MKLRPWHLLVLALSGIAEAEEQTVSLTLRFADEPAVAVVVGEHEVASYRSFRHGHGFGVVARRVGGGGGLEVRLVELAGERPDYRPGRVLATRRVAGEGEEVSLPGLPLPIELTVRSETRPSIDARRCAVLCGGVEVAGLIVSTSCGTCSGSAARW